MTRCAALHGGIMFKFCFAGLLALTFWAVTAAVTPLNVPSREFLPLRVGLRWEYGVNGQLPAVAVITVTESTTVAGKQWFHLVGLPGGDLWVRTEGLVVRARRTLDGAEGALYDFASPDAYTDLLGREKRIVSSRTSYTGPSGSIPETLVIHYSDTFQNGVTEEIFAPGVGLVRWRAARRSLPTICWHAPPRCPTTEKPVDAGDGAHADKYFFPVKEIFLMFFWHATSEIVGTHQKK